MKIQTLMWKSAPSILLASVIVSWCCASQAGDASTPAQTNSPANLHLSPQEVRQREAARQQWEQFEARAKAAAATRRADEIARLTSMVPAHLVKQYDSNGDGMIDRKEWRAYRKEVEQQRATLLAARGLSGTNAPAGP